MSSTMLFSRFLVVVLILQAYGQAPKRRFEYKFSFKGPHLVQRDNSVPFWEYFGDALAGDEGIRITPSLRSKKGSVWSKNKLEGTGWEIEAGLRITGRGRVGADGMAIWFSESRPTHQDNPQDLTVFGAADRWRGLGVFLDSFDNDGQHNNPYVMAVVNDGSMSYDHLNDGNTQNLGGCLRDFRNKPFPVRVKIEYYSQMLTVKVHNGLTNNQDDFELCMSASNVVLPSSGFIGISAATGGLADDHDALYLLTHSLHDPSTDSAQVSDEERQRFEREFQQYQDELNRAKQQYKEEHPDMRHDDDEFGDDDWFQGQNEKELKQIFDGQNMIHVVIRELNRKLDELMGRQEMVLSRVNTLGGVQQQQPPQQQQQQQGLPPAQGSGNLNLNQVINTQNSILSQMGDIRFVVNDIQQKANSLSSQLAQRGGASGGSGVGMQDQMNFHEIRDRLNTVAQEVQSLGRRPQPSLQCPPPTVGGCLTVTVFVVAMVIQFVLTIGYMVYRSNREQQAKKFY